MKPRLLLCAFFSFILSATPPGLFSQITWTEVGASLKLNNMVMGMTSTKDGKVFIGSTGKGTYMTTDHGNSWAKKQLGTGSQDNGMTFVVYAHPNNNNIYAGQSNGNIFASTDNGSTFSVIGNLSTGVMPTPTSVAGDPDGNAYVLFRSGEVFIFKADNTKLKSITNKPWNSAWSIDVDKNKNIYVSTWGNGIYKSTDMGETWNSASTGLPKDADVHKVIVAPNGDIFAGLSDTGGIYKSEDGGQTWELSWNITQKPIIMDIVFFNDTTIFAVSTNDIYRSDDFGKTWQSIMGDLDNTAVVAPERLTIDKANYLYIGMQTGRMYRSTNPLIYVDNSILINVVPDADVNIAPGKTAAFTITTKDKDQKPLSGVSIKIKDDVNGTSPGKLSDASGKAVFNINVPAGQAEGDYNLYFSATKAGYDNSDTLVRIVHVQKEDSWHKISSYQYDERIISLLTVGNDTILCGTSGKGLIASTNSGNSWFAASSQLSAFTSVKKIVSNGKGTIYIATDWDGVLKSNNITAPWVKMDASVSNAVNLAITEDGTLFACDNNGITYRSSDDGKTFSEMQNYPSAIKKVADIITVKGNSSFIFIAAGKAGLFCSKDNGDNWEQLKNGIEGLEITSVAEGESGQIYVGTSASGIYSSNISNLSFTAANIGISTEQVTGLLAGQNIIFARCFGSGVWYSNDQGKNWTEFNDGFESMSFKDVYALALGANGNLYAGTFDQNIYERVAPQSTDVEERPVTGTSELKAYPNPSGNDIIIEYPLSYNENVKVIIYDINGKIINTLEQGYQTYCTYSVKWDGKDKTGKDVPNGIYILNTKFGESSRTVKVQIKR